MYEGPISNNKEINQFSLPWTLLTFFLLHLYRKIIFMFECHISDNNEIQFFAPLPGKPLHWDFFFFFFFSLS